MSHLAGHLCGFYEFVDGNGQFALDGGGVPVIVESAIEIRLLGEVLHTLHVDHLHNGTQFNDSILNFNIVGCRAQ